jgi:ammonia channel protein AmtB
VRTLGSAVLGFEALVVLLAVVPAVTLADRNQGAIVVAGLLLAALCIVSAALLRRPVGLVLGTATQLLVLACGVVLPVMFALGGLFAVLWVVAVVLGLRVDRYAARRRADRRTEEPGSPP